MDAPLKTPDCNENATGAFHAAHCSEVLARVKANLSKRAEYYRTKTDDPYGMNTALYVAMLEVSNSIDEALK